MNKLPRTGVALPFAALLIAAGCTVGPGYHAPRIQEPNTFSSLPDASARAGALASAPVGGQETVQRWWTTFRDPELDSLIQRAVDGNRDLKLAALRVRQARAERTLLVGNLFPVVNVGGGYNRGHGSNNVQLPLGGSGGGASGGTSAPTTRFQPQAASRQPVALDTPNNAEGSGGGGGATPAPASGAPAGPQSPFGEGGLPGVTTNLYQVGFDASWEIDVFGGTRRALEAANAQVAAAEENRRSVLVSLLAEVAQSYIELRSSQVRLEIARQNLAVQRDVLGITRAKLKAGFDTDLNVARQASQTSLTAASIPTIEESIETSLHALAFLIGAEPDALRTELDAHSPLPNLPPEVPVGVPSDLLRRRPDVRQAERQLAAATANVGVATAELFPRFSLTGTAGLDSTKLVDLPRWSSHYYSIIPGVSWPILDWGRARANLRLQDEMQRQAFQVYENTVAQALRDVEDALVHYRHEQDRRIALQAAAKSAQDAFAIARQQFDHGVVDLTVVLDAQRTLLGSQDSLAQSDAAIRSNLIALYKALGGGWELIPEVAQN